MATEGSVRDRGVSAVGFWQSPQLAGLEWLAHGVTERAGGVSDGGWASLNLGLHVGDDADAVAENRRRAAAALGFGFDDLVCAEQVHGGNAAVVGEAEAGRGARGNADALPGVDALVTDTSGLLLALFFADCVPVLLVDPLRRVVGIAHAGWRGLVAGVLRNTVATMGRTFGSRPADLVAGIGPCIGVCCYEVGQEVSNRFDPADVRTGADTDCSPHVDLAAAAARQLRAAGIPAERIDHAGHCTSCLSDRYFSHRRDRGGSGRIGALIGLRAA